MENLLLNGEAVPPLYRQNYLRFLALFVDGRLKTSDSVSSIRGLASELNLARGIIQSAYQLLISERYLIGRRAAGSVVSSLIKSVPTSSQSSTFSLPQYPLIHSGELLWSGNVLYLFYLENAAT